MLKIPKANWPFNPFSSLKIENKWWRFTSVVFRSIKLSLVLPIKSLWAPKSFYYSSPLLPSRSELAQLTLPLIIVSLARRLIACQAVDNYRCQCCFVHLEGRFCLIIRPFTLTGKLRHLILIFMTRILFSPTNNYTNKYCPRQEKNL